MRIDEFETVLPDQLRRRYRSPVPPPPYIRPKPRRRGFSWLAIAVVLVCVSAIGAALISRQDVPRGTISSPPAIPVPVPIPDTVEVRKAGYILHRQTIMPYGEKLVTRYLGSVPNQESLPLSGNHFGDAYQVGSYEFVWVSPGVWIDPVN